FISSRGRLPCAARHGLTLSASGRQVAVPVDALRRRAAVNAELQVLRLVVGHGQLLGDAHGQRQVASQLAHDDGDADVAGVDLDVPPRRLLGHPQASRLAVAAAHRAVHESGGQVVGDRLVHLLLRAVLVRFEDYRDLGRKRNRSSCCKQQGV
uniref:Uncharacterized protein n=1 Tax=Scleropages formosus TaxID=113540 RepID=A0A8C9TAI6_SCLFO